MKKNTKQSIQDKKELIAAPPSTVQREERRQLINRSTEMQRLQDSDECINQLAGLVQWATLEGLTGTTQKIRKRGSRGQKGKG